jgi:glycosyltransferase involved in cell wall biosynthesis
MRVCFVNLHHPAGITDPDALVEADVTRRGFGAALVARGHAVTVVQEFPRAARVERDGVTWEMVPPSRTTVGTRRLLAGLGHPAPVVPAPATAVLAPVERARPDVIHSFDLAFYPSLALLGRLAHRLHVPLVAHFHGGAPARNPALRLIERYALAHTARLLFTSRSRGEDWVRSGALADGARIAELVETSTFLHPIDRGAARRRTGITGDPVYLCVGRLDPVKDPLTTVDGFVHIARARPGARLVLVWRDTPLRAAVEARIASAGLRDRVELRGALPHDAMQDLYGSADYLLQSSIREVCGVAVLEALACGVVPILTDIPSFRRLTDAGRVGRLFPRGDAVALAAQALSLEPADLREQARAAREWFERSLAFPVLASELEAIYRAAGVTAP